MALRPQYKVNAAEKCCSVMKESDGTRSIRQSSDRLVAENFSLNHMLLCKGEVRRQQVGPATVGPATVEIKMQYN